MCQGLEQVIHPWNVKWKDLLISNDGQVKLIWHIARDLKDSLSVQKNSDVYILWKFK